MIRAIISEGGGVLFKESAVGVNENPCGRSYTHCFGKNYV
jgi:hypothetical protein